MPLYDSETGIQIDAGIDGHDEHINELTTLFEELQPYSAEAMTAGTEDVFSFAVHENTFYFGVITLNEKKGKAEKPSIKAYDGPSYIHSSSLTARQGTATERSYGGGSGGGISQTDADIVDDFVRDWACSNQRAASPSSQTPSSPPTACPDDDLFKSRRRHRKHNPKSTPIDAIHTSSSSTRGTLPEILHRTPLHNMGSSIDRDEEKQEEEETFPHDDNNNNTPSIPDPETSLYQGFTSSDPNSYPRSLFTDIPEELLHDYSSPDAPSDPLKKCIGLIYLITSSAPAPHIPSSVPGELNIGIILSPLYRTRGYARTSVSLVLSWVFTEMHLHRIQASLVIDRSTGSPYRDRAMSLFTQSCFSHEGTRRRALFNPISNQWNDVQYLSILDTEYSMREYFTPAPRSLWDEMLARHQREREDLLRWEESKGLGGRSASRETIRMPVSPTTTMSMRDGDSAMGGDDARTPSPTDSFSTTRSSLPPTSPAGSFSSTWSMVSGDRISSASSSSDAFSDYGSVRESDTEDR